MVFSFMQCVFVEQLSGTSARNSVAIMMQPNDSRATFLWLSKLYLVEWETILTFLQLCRSISSDSAPLLECFFMSPFYFVAVASPLLIPLFLHTCTHTVIAEWIWSYCFRHIDLHFNFAPPSLALPPRLCLTYLLIAHYIKLS